MKKFFLACLALVFAFISCASNKIAGEQLPAVYVTNTKKVNILTAENILRPIDEVQLFEGSFGDKSFSMPVYIQADKDGIFVSLLNDVGTSLGELSFSENKVEFSSAILPQNLKAEYIVWDIQLAFYNPEIIKEHLSRYKLGFDFFTDGTSETRKITSGKTTIEEITIGKNSIVIKNFLRGYEYHLRGAGDE